MIRECMGGLLEGNFLRRFLSESVIPNAPHRNAILIHFDEDKSTKFRGYLERERIFRRYEDDQNVDDADESYTNSKPESSPRYPPFSPREPPPPTLVWYRISIETFDIFVHQ